MDDDDDGALNFLVRCHYRRADPVSSDFPAFFSGDGTMPPVSAIGRINGPRARGRVYISLYSRVMDRVGGAATL